jgi:ATP-dependent Lon protease
LKINDRHGKPFCSTNETLPSPLAVNNLFALSTFGVLEAFCILKFHLFLTKRLLYTGFMTANALVVTLQNLQTKLDANPSIPPEMRRRCLEQIARATIALQFGGNIANIEITEKYIDLVCRLPWATTTTDNLDIRLASQIMESKHYGLPRVKERVLQYLASVVMIKKKDPNAVLRAPSLFFVGLAGTGKTSFAPIIAESLGRRFVRIPFGGLANALDLRGQSKTTPYAQPGVILRCMAECGVRNPVILLDELDRVNPSERASIMGALLEILDPEQNYHFTDYFLDYPFDLSQVMFIATSNNTSDISTAVLDRLEIVQMPSYTDDEKIHIGKNFVLPRKLAEAGLSPAQVTIADNLWGRLVRPLGFEPGIRSLERLLEGIARKAALNIVTGKIQSLHLTEENMNQYVEITLASI